jgi:hypothetical protein
MWPVSEPLSGRYWATAEDVLFLPKADAGVQL